MTSLPRASSVCCIWRLSAIAANLSTGPNTTIAPLHFHGKERDRPLRVKGGDTGLSGVCPLTLELLTIPAGLSRLGPARDACSGDASTADPDAPSNAQVRHMRR